MYDGVQRQLAINGSVELGEEMREFNPLTFAFEAWFDTPMAQLPPALRRRVKKDFLLISWDQLTADQRRSRALQLDYWRDPATQQDQQFWWDFFEQMSAIKEQIAHWEATATPTAKDLEQKETRLAELKKELARMDAQQRAARGDYFPVRKPARKKTAGTPTPQYIAYPKAMAHLVNRLQATPEELAAWVFMGPNDGGLAAYMNANELDPPPRFGFAYAVGTSDYVAPLMGCWFKAEDIDTFEPSERYITGTELIERWKSLLGLHPESFIIAKIKESRLQDFHPIYGGTSASFPEQAEWAPLASGLFQMSLIERIESEDFAAVEMPPCPTSAVQEPSLPHKADVGSAEWRKANAKKAADALHNLPGGSRDKQAQIREIWASGKYSTKARCAEEEWAALGMSFDAARRALKNMPDPSRC